MQSPLTSLDCPHYFFSHIVNSPLVILGDTSKIHVRDHFFLPIQNPLPALQLARNNTQHLYMV